PRTEGRKEDGLFAMHTKGHRPPELSDGRWRKAAHDGRDGGRRVRVARRLLISFFGSGDLGAMGAPTAGTSRERRRTPGREPREDVGCSGGLQRKGKRSNTLAARAMPMATGTRRTGI